MKNEAENISDLSNAVAVKTLGLYEISAFSSTETQIVVIGDYTAPMLSLVKDDVDNPIANIEVDFSISVHPIGSIGYELTKSSEGTNENGLANVQLKLGNVPAEYGVTATCESCIPEASSVTFNCCGKLPNDNFSQSHVPAWSYECYANNDCQTTPNATIGWRGCAVTALATLSNYHANTSPELNISTTTPGSLNTYLRELPNYQGYNAANDVDFGSIDNYSTEGLNFIDNESGNIGIAGTQQELLERSDSEILAGRPVIFRVTGPHFIVVIGKCGDSYIISDPAGGVEGLYDPDDSDAEFVGIRIFRP